MGETLNWITCLGRFCRQGIAIKGRKSEMEGGNSQNQRKWSHDKPHISGAWSVVSGQAVSLLPGSYKCRFSGPTSDPLSEELQGSGRRMGHMSVFTSPPGGFEALKLLFHSFIRSLNAKVPSIVRLPPHSKPWEATEEEHFTKTQRHMLGVNTWWIQWERAWVNGSLLYRGSGARKHWSPGVLAGRRPGPSDQTYIHFIVIDWWTDETLGKN